MNAVVDETVTMSQHKWLHANPSSPSPLVDAISYRCGGEASLVLRETRTTVHTVRERERGPPLGGYFTMDHESGAAPPNVSQSRGIGSGLVTNIVAVLAGRLSYVQVCVQVGVSIGDGEMLHQSGCA